MKWKKKWNKKKENGKKNDKMYILFGGGGITSQPCSDCFNSYNLIGYSAGNSDFWLVQFPVIWLVGAIKHFNPLLG